MLPTMLFLGRPSRVASAPRSLGFNEAIEAAALDAEQSSGPQQTRRCISLSDVVGQSLPPASEPFPEPQREWRLPEPSDLRSSSTEVPADTVAREPTDSRLPTPQLLLRRCCVANGGDRPESVEGRDWLLALAKRMSWEALHLMPATRSNLVVEQVGDVQQMLYPIQLW